MKNWILHVKNFGKIKSADIEVKPLTLFVGDNNSGKSYLLSIIWYLKSYIVSSAVFGNYEKELQRETYSSLSSKIKNFISKSSSETEVITIDSELLEIFINRQLKNNKTNIINSLFNYDKINIDEIYIEIPKQSITLECYLEDFEDTKLFRIQSSYIRYAYRLHADDETAVERILIILFKIFARLVMDRRPFEKSYYFPAARTGFVLSRNTINQNSRRSLYDEIINDIAPENQQFTKPILDFLDMLELSGSGRMMYKKIVAWIESNLSHGTYSYINEQSREVGFIPKNKEKVLPMRASSAVVTELLPLVVLLKNSSRRINSICYEEPEMCLHPQLQLYMGRCLVRLVNKCIGIIATTHSDIIMQHISNMCILDKHKEKDKILNEFSYDKDDVLNIEKVAVYQFTEENDGSIVTRLNPDGNSFNIPTFNNALSDILDKTYRINDIYGDGYCD